MSRGSAALVAASLLGVFLRPGLAAATCPEEVPRSEAAVISGLLDDPAAAELSALEIEAVVSGRAVVRRLCVPGYGNPRYRVYRAVKASPETVAAVLSDPAEFADRLPLTFASREVPLPPADPALGREDVAVRAVRMRYFLVPPWVAEDYTLRFVAGPYARGAEPAGRVLPGTRYDAFAFKWTRLDSRIATHLDGSARFEPLGPAQLLLRYDTFVAFGAASDEARYRPRPPGVEGAIRKVVRRIDRHLERAQRLRDAAPESLLGAARTRRARLDALVEEARSLGEAVSSFPADDLQILGFDGNPD